jgi:hypothetical protein
VKQKGPFTERKIGVRPSRGRYEGESGGAFPAVATIGTQCGLSDAQARRYIRELQAKKFIEVAAKAGSTSTYVFIWHDALDGDTGQGAQGL